MLSSADKKPARPASSSAPIPVGQAELGANRRVGQVHVPTQTQDVGLGRQLPPAKKSRRSITSQDVLDGDADGFEETPALRRAVRGHGWIGKGGGDKSSSGGGRDELD